ncbi:MAG: N-acetyltransferase [Phycisphaerae bacterium]
MEIRSSRVTDAQTICDLVNHYAERGLMLHLSLQDVYESLREFQVVEDDGEILGCVAVDIFWADLAEVRSLAVSDKCRGKGIGSRLVGSAIADARQLGVKTLFTLTYEQKFFERQGFEVIDRHSLPEKVWRACLNCPKVDACDEIAMLRKIG